MNIPFLDLYRMHKPIHDELRDCLDDQVYRSEFVLGQSVEKFEEQFKSIVGCDFAVGVNSGTSALHLALLAGGIRAGDEVIVPTLTFIATAAAVSYIGATPRFVDVCPETWTIDPESIEKAISDRTKAIVVVHLHGLMAMMPSVMEIARHHKLLVIEDAAQSHLASLDDCMPGSYGDAACYSFYPGKNLGALGEGGAVTTNNQFLAEQVKLLRNWGAKEKYVHEVLGFNYRLESLQAAFLSVKLSRLEAWTTEREEIATKYGASLDKSKLRLQRTPSNSRHARHIFAIATPKRKVLIDELQKAGIGFGFHYPIPVHLQPAYQSLRQDNQLLPVAENLASELISLPLYPGLADHEIMRVIDVVNSAVS